MAEHNKTMSAAKSDEAKAAIKSQKQNTTTGLSTCNNILAMTQALHSKSPSFIGDKKINLSWKEAVKALAPSTAAAAGYAENHLFSHEIPPSSPKLNLKKKEEERNKNSPSSFVG
ncbi:apoptosis inhibitor 5-like protein API5 [Actinidia eriantha]|uniref:apoptosis inhibitor 5-like protein API5 n=1 Tax=Actinidia eriantha TaxID=165200 RepID=UPI002583845A|nr:apoptosis inhibitor 5-like protein API5 [Actinidia eriantha]